MTRTAHLATVVLSLTAFGALAACDGDLGTAPGGAPDVVLTADAEAFVGETVTLSAAGTTDPDGDDLSFAWVISARPAGSQASLQDAGSNTASFVPDRVGTYSIRLTVSDGENETVEEADVEALAPELSGGISSDSTLPEIGGPYSVTGTVVLEATLTIEPGVTLRFEDGVGLTVGLGGALTAEGTQTAPISFLGATESAGSWRGINIGSARTGNVLRFVEVAHGGGVGDFGGVFVSSGSRVVITDSRIHDNATTGVNVRNDATLGEWARNELADNENAGLFMEANQLGDLDAGSVYAGGTTEFAVEVRGGQVQSDATWLDLGAPYLFTFRPVLEAAVEIEPGAELVFEGGASLTVGTGGSLRAEGAPGKSTTFRGDAEVKGAWQGIIFGSASANNVLDGVDVGFGGGQNFANVFISGASSATVINSSIHDSDGCGIENTRGGSLTQSGNTFANNDDGDICT